MTDDSKKTISIPSGDVLVAEEKPALIDEDKVPPEDELQDISVSDFTFPETDENTTLAGDDMTITLESDTESEDNVEEDKGPREDELHEEFSLSDVIFLESDENTSDEKTMPARDVDNSLTPGLDTESEEDVSGEDESPQQDELKSEIFRPGEDEDTMPLSASEIFRPGEDEDTMPLTNVDRNMTKEREPEADEVFDSDSDSEYAKKGGDVKKNISGGQVGQGISVGVALVDEAKPVLADEDLPLIRSYSTGSVAVIFVITYKCFPFQHRMSLCRGLCPSNRKGGWPRKGRGK